MNREDKSDEFSLQNYGFVFTSACAISLLASLRPVAAQTSSPSGTAVSSAVPIDASFLATLITPIDTVDYANGRGIQGATQEALPAGHASATTGSVNPLTTNSHGVQDLHGLELRERIVDGKHLTVLAASQKIFSSRRERS
jgi:hypothetical protein